MLCADSSAGAAAGSILINDTVFKYRIGLIAKNTSSVTTGIASEDNGAEGNSRRVITHINTSSLGSEYRHSVYHQVAPSHAGIVVTAGKSKAIYNNAVRSTVYIRYNHGMCRAKNINRGNIC